MHIFIYKVYLYKVCGCLKESNIVLLYFFLARLVIQGPYRSIYAWLYVCVCVCPPFVGCLQKRVCHYNR